MRLRRLLRETLFPFPAFADGMEFFLSDGIGCRGDPKICYCAVGVRAGDHWSSDFGSSRSGDSFRISIAASASSWRTSTLMPPFPGIMLPNMRK